MKNRARPCLLHQIGRCSAPCVIPQESYAQNVQLARRILTGDSEPIIAELSEQMKRLSDAMEFEKAAEIRDKIAALTSTSIRGMRHDARDNGIMWNESVCELENWLGIKIERACVFDNSHLFGRTPVGAMIVFGHGGFVKSDYRHFKLKETARAGNDIAMMQEFIARATARGKFDLIIVDGGPAQWNIAHQTAPHTPILGVTKGEVRDGDEHFIMPDQTISRDLAKDSKLFLLLRAVRDEAHRFAISFHRAMRAKTMVASRLDEIEGIGPSRKRALLHHFGSVRQIADADLAALQKVPGLGGAAAGKIYSYFHS
jgi:excinuclease UvrABC nuclease subunit